MKTKNILFYILLSVFVVWVGILCFYHLDEAGTQNWDEARHIVNAYEMMSNDTPWINTYRGEIDYYNFKPPLSMWCIMLSFKLFGINAYSMRLQSAVAMFLTFLLVSGFLFKNFGKRVAIIFCLLFITGEDIFFFHMARSADADALYILMYVIAILCLYMAEKKPWYFCLCCLFFSFAFLAKCLHVASGILITICYLPRIYKQLRIKHYIAGGLCFAVPVGIWALIRFLYDGFAFFYGMLHGEVIKRVQTAKDYTMYIQYFFSKPLFVIPLCLSVFAALFMILYNRKSGNLSNHTISDIIRKIISHKLYLFFLWFLIPVCIYSASGAFLEWYFYICFIPFYIICGSVLAEFTTFSKRFRPIAALLLVILIGGVGFQTWKNINTLNTLEYICNPDIRHDLLSMIEETSLYHSRIYIENSRNEYLPQNFWEQNCIADAYIAGDLEPVDGGIPLFIEDDEDALLIISKELFADYSSILAGRVILVDGHAYLVFINKFYE